jgi:hypothetical protein
VADVDEWQLRGQRWTALGEASDYLRGTAEDRALSMVFDLGDGDLATALYYNDSGILMIRDVDALVARARPGLRHR